MRADAVGRTACGPNVTTGTSTDHYKPTTVAVKLPLVDWTAKVTCPQVTQGARLRGVSVGGSRSVDDSI